MRRKLSRPELTALYDLTEKVVERYENSKASVVTMKVVSTDFEATLQIKEKR